MVFISKTMRRIEIFKQDEMIDLNFQELPWAVVWRIESKRFSMAIVRKLRKSGCEKKVLWLELC